MSNGIIGRSINPPSSFRVVDGPKEFKDARIRIGTLLKSLRPRRHPTKGDWESSKMVDHLVVRVETENMRLLIKKRKVVKVQDLEKRLLTEVKHERKYVTRKSFIHFCGMCVSIMITKHW